MTNQHAHDPGAHGETAVHMPDPSVWPIVVGLAALILGAALVWWSRDSESTFAGPLLGAAIVSVLVAAGGWAYEDGRMKRKAESHEPTGAGNARFTQVMTFAIAEGKFDAARAPGGIIGRIESSDADLRNLAGFQDLRIIAAPATSGPSQVLVETTWSNREGLATYDETRQTVLDMVSGLDDQVVPGSVQVFDMEVVRDTKDVSVRFGAGAAATLLGGLAIGGLLIGAGLTLFQEEGGGGGGGETPPPSGFAQTGNIVARNTSFPESQISLPPNTEVTIRFDNKDASPPHNIQFFAGPETSGPLLAGCTAGCQAGDVTTAISSGPIVQEFTFTTPGPGEYAFNCIVHPTQMVGTLTVVEGAPIPGAAAPPSTADPSQSGTIVAKDTSFAQTAISVPPNTEVTLRLDNQDVSPPHNIQFFAGPEASGSLLTGCTAGCPAGDVTTAISPGPIVQEFTFTTPGPGEYAYNCIVHPTEMAGTLTVAEGAPVPGAG